MKILHTFSGGIIFFFVKKIPIVSDKEKEQKTVYSLSVERPPVYGSLEIK